MDTITVNISTQTAKLLQNKQTISEQDFFDILQMNVVEKEENFMEYSDFKKIVGIQKIARTFWLKIIDEEKLLQLKSILENEKILT